MVDGLLYIGGGVGWVEVLAVEEDAWPCGGVGVVDCGESVWCWWGRNRFGKKLFGWR